MSPEELKAMLEEAVLLGKQAREANETLQKTISGLTDQNTELQKKFEAVQAKIADGGGEPDEVKKLAETIDDLQNEISDLRGKMRHVGDVIPGDAKAEMEKIAGKTIGQWLKTKGQDSSAKDLFKFVEKEGAEHFKTLNITNPDEGGRAVAEILSRAVIEYAREYSPVLQYVGRKPEMTRNFRELVLVSYPSVAEGVENVAGTNFPETTTQEYKEVKSHVFKVSAKPRITDEAMYGADIDLYGHLVRLLGREISIYLAAQVLYGNGTGKNARGILSSNRVDITNTTGESFKPTLATDPDDARPADFFPVKPTGVSGAIGTDDKSIVDFVIDTVNEMPTMWLPGSMWYMTRKTKGIFEKVRDSENRPLFRTSFSDDGGSRLMLNGYPVVIDDTMPELEANSSFAIFGRLDQAFALNDGDIDKMLLDPYSVDDCTVVKTSKEMFEMIQNSDAIIVCSATTNSAGV